MHTEKYHMVLVAYRLTDDVTSDVHAGVRELMDYGVRRMYSASGKDGRLYSGRDTTYTTRATRLTIVTPRKLIMKVSVPKEEYLLKKKSSKILFERDIQLLLFCLLVLNKNLCCYFWIKRILKHIGGIFTTCIRQK